MVEQDFPVGAKVRVVPAYVPGMNYGLDYKFHQYLIEHPTAIMTVVGYDGTHRVGVQLPEGPETNNIGHDCNHLAIGGRGQWIYPHNLELVDKPKVNKRKKVYAPVSIKVEIEGLAVGSNTYSMSVMEPNVQPVKLGQLGSYTYDGARQLLKDFKKSGAALGIIGNQFHRVMLLKKYGKAVIKLIDAIEGLSKCKGKLISGPRNAGD